MRKILLVIDMQNDFIDGSLGTNEAVKIVDNVINKIKKYPSENIFATKDTHETDYLATQEGKYLPVEHCIRGTNGWNINDNIQNLIPATQIFEKGTFGSVTLAEKLKEIADKEDVEVEVVGICTDICVISNVLLIKAYLPEINITVDSSCCAGVTPAKHDAALETMRSCQINVL
nr:isochorismatase family cysteine hydrolase [uncultured Catonella sp.]